MAAEPGSAGSRRSSNGERRALPHNLEAEAAILGGIIVKNDLLDFDAVGALEVADFYHYQHQLVFAGIRNLEAATKAIDVVTLEAEIERTGNLAAVGGIAFLGELTLRAPTTDNILAYTKIVRDKAMLRRLAVLTDRAAGRVYDWDDEADELLGETIADLQQVERGYREASEKLPIISVPAALEQLVALAGQPIYETPFPELNNALGFGGLLGGQAYTVVSGTGAGKTSWVATVAKHHGNHGGEVLIATFEMFAAYFIARMAASELGVHSNQILRNEIRMSDVIAAVPRRLQFLDRPSMSILRRSIEKSKKANGRAPLVIVDYIQALAEIVMATMQRPDPRQANALVSRELLQIATETGAPFLVVSATSRSTSKKLAQDIRKTPPRDLVDAAKETSQIEYDGAGIIVISLSDEQDVDGQIATMSVAKARFGETCHIDSRFQAARGHWHEIGRVTVVPKVDASTVTAQGVRDAISRVIKQAGPQKSKTKIWKFTGRSKQSVMSEIDAMLESGALVYSAGAIALPNTEIPAPSPMIQALIRGVE